MATRWKKGTEFRYGVSEDVDLVSGQERVSSGLEPLGILKPKDRIKGDSPG